MVVSFPSRWVDPGTTGLKEEKKLAGKQPLPLTPVPDGGEL